MKTLIGASLAPRGPGVWAQTFIQIPHPGYCGADPNSPALTGGGSVGHNRLQQRF
jgi:hypothetical protein